MYLAVFLLCLTAAVYAKPNSVQWFEVHQNAVILNYEPYEVTWYQFKLNFGKKYRSTEHEKERHDIFMGNIGKIEKHNLKYVNGQTSYYQGVNQFTDMTVEEYRQYNKLKMAGSSDFQCTEYKPSTNGTVPVSVDWRKKGYVTGVKNQRQCGSCWAFSATGSLEGQYFRKTGMLVSLSEQQLVDCAGSFGNYGCEGGLMNLAFAYIYSVGGLESEWNYPYEGVDDTCQFDASKAVAQLHGCRKVPTKSEAALQQAVASVGPVSVAIDASHPSFQSYAGGVYDEPACSQIQLDHGVLVVGYGRFRGEEYWLVKNSWGPAWGLNGYIMMSRNKNNQCGIATEACFPVV